MLSQKGALVREDLAYPVDLTICAIKASSESVIVVNESEDELLALVERKEHAVSVAGRIDVLRDRRGGRSRLEVGGREHGQAESVALRV